MPAIPEFVLRKLYVADSLIPRESGFIFELNNTFAPVTLTGFSLIIDNMICDPGEVTISTDGLSDYPAGGISAEHPFTLSVNTVVKVSVHGVPPQEHLVIRAETKEAGVLQFGIPVSVERTIEPEIKHKPEKITRLLNRVKYAAKVFRVQQDPQHPSFHYAPPANWINDPNGLIYWKGSYHLFYQYNPIEAVWGNIHWGHAVSSDMLRWKHLPIALIPSPDGADAGGCYSGCAVDNNGTPTLIYTGVYPETQCLAIPTSGDLITWRKRKQPIIPSAPQGMQLEGFRDPYVWQEAGEWRMIVGSGLTDVGGAVLIYRSKNLIDWRYMGILFQGDSGTADPLWTGTMWECPSLFPLGEKWILIVSVHSHEGAVYSIYYTGQYTVDRFIPDGPPRLLDGGAEGCFYAPQTFIERKGQRVMFGWLRECRSEQAQVLAGWSGAISIPRYLSLDENGDLSINPEPALERLRKTHEKLIRPNQISENVKGGCLEMLIRVPPDTEKWSGVHLLDNLQNGILIGYDAVNGVVVVDCRHAGGLISAVSVDPPGLHDMVLHVFLDGSMIETFIDDRTPVSARFYIPKPQSLRVRLVGRAKVDLWEVKP